MIASPAGCNIGVAVLELRGNADDRFEFGRDRLEPDGRQKNGTAGRCWKTPPDGDGVGLASVAGGLSVLQLACDPRLPVVWVDWSANVWSARCPPAFHRSRSWAISVHEHVRGGVATLAARPVALPSSGASPPKTPASNSSRWAPKCRRYEPVPSCAPSHLLSQLERSTLDQFATEPCA